MTVRRIMWSLRSEWPSSASSLNDGVIGAAAHIDETDSQSRAVMNQRRR